METKKLLIAGTIKKTDNGSDKVTIKFATCVCGNILTTAREAINDQCERCYWQEKKAELKDDFGEKDIPEKPEDSY